MVVSGLLSWETSGYHLRIHKTVCQMIVDHANRPHKGVDDGGPHKFEAQRFQVPADLIGEGCGYRHILYALPMPDDGRMIHIVPNHFVKGSVLLLHRKKQLCVVDGGIDFQAISDDTLILHERPELFIIILSHHIWTKAVKGRPVSLSLFQHGNPRKSCLHGF